MQVGKKIAKPIIKIPNGSRALIGFILIFFTPGKQHNGLKRQG